jgi:hypothetical protein
MTELAASSAGQIWLANASAPTAATTAVRASSTGIAAATIAPNASSKITSEMGIESSSARWKSRPFVSAIALSTLASPYSPV